MSDYRIIEINKFNDVRLYDDTKEAEIVSDRLTKEDVQPIKEAHKGFKVTGLYLGYVEPEIIDFLCSYKESVNFISIKRELFEQYKDRKIDFLECFENLRSIKALPFSTSKENGIVDFTVFPKLEEAYINTYWPGAESVFKAKSLKKLTIWSYPFKDLSPMKELVNLEFIQLNQPSIRNFKGAPGLKKLKEIKVYYAMGLKSLEGIEHFENLESILISASGRPKDLSPIKKLKKIRWLIIDKTPTLKPIEGHESIEAVHIDRVEDRDLSPLFKIPKLRGYVVDRNFENKLPYTEHEIYTYIRFYKFKK